MAATLPLLPHIRRLIDTAAADLGSDAALLSRFVQAHDQAAFAVLVARHGPMVYRLCRRVLGDAHAAEDVVQATFLVLARKAAHLRQPQTLAAWLHGVAYRLALKARAGRVRRQQIETRSLQFHSPPAVPDPLTELSARELLTVLDAELQRLPEKYRLPLILCCLEGRSQPEAARLLGWTPSSVKGRLDRGRAKLHQRLLRRGLTLSAALLALEAAREPATAALPAALARAIMRTAGGEVPASVAALAEGGIAGMVGAKMKLLFLAVMLGAVTTGVGVLASQERPRPEQAPPVADAPGSPRAQPPAGTDRHGDPLPAGAVARLGTVRFRHADPVHAIALGPDGKSIVSAADRTVHVWDVATGKEQRRFEGFEPYLLSVAISANGKLLAVGDHLGHIILWDIAANREVRRIEAHPKPDPNRQGPVGVLRLQLTPDGKRLASIGADNALRLWDTATGKAVPGIGGQFHSVGRFALSPDGKTLAGIVEEKGTWEVRQWDIAAGREGKRLATTREGRIVELAFSPDGKLLAVDVGKKDWTRPCPIQLWDVAAAREVRTLRGVKGWANFAFSPDGKSLLASGSAENTVHVWDVNTAADLRGLRVDRSTPTYPFLLCADGKTLVSTFQGEHGFHVWGLDSGKEMQSSGDAVCPVVCVSYSPDGNLMAAGSCDGVIRLWDVAAKKEVRRFQHDPGWLASVLFSPDGRKLASAGLQEIWIWDAAGGKTLRRFKGTKDRYATICSLTWSGDGKVLAGWLREQRRICLWDADTGAELRRLDCGETSINALAFSPDGKTLAAAGGTFGRGNCLLLWEMATGRLLRSFAPKHTLHGVIFSPDGRTLAAGGRRSQLAGDSPEERDITLWEVVSGRQRLAFKAGEGVTDLAFSPDGRLLAAACNKTYTYSHIRGDGCVDAVERGAPKRQRVRLWDVAAAKELAPLEGHQGAITSLISSPDGKLLASASNDTTVLLWDATRLKVRRPAAAPLTSEQLESLWADLAGPDAAKAYRAIRTLASAPQASVDFLKRRLRPVAPADARQVARLIADLDSEEFARRDRAMAELEKLGEAAAPDLHKALAGNPSLEVKRRIEQLLEKANGPERVRGVRALEALEMIGTPQAREVCAGLAGGVAVARLTREAKATLGRLDRRR